MHWTKTVPHLRWHVLERSTWFTNLVSENENCYQWSGREMTIGELREGRVILIMPILHYSKTKSIYPVTSTFHHYNHHQRNHYRAEFPFKASNCVKWSSSRLFWEVPDRWIKCHYEISFCRQSCVPRMSEAVHWEFSHLPGNRCPLPIYRAP